jgi:hypothetical protein
MVMIAVVAVAVALGASVEHVAYVRGRASHEVTIDRLGKVVGVTANVSDKVAFFGGTSGSLPILGCHVFILSTRILSHVLPPVSYHVAVYPTSCPICWVCSVVCGACVCHYPVVHRVHHGERSRTVLMFHTTLSVRPLPEWERRVVPAVRTPM